jgi:putative SOS response-associated peptidase YedK
VCGRYSAAITPEQLKLRFGIDEFREVRLPPTLPRYTLPGAVWGFRPPWLSDPKRPPPINARSETAATSGLFKNSLDRYRRLVPASGFFEWQALPGTKSKIPHHIRLKDDPILAFAGIYTPPTREQPATYAIRRPTPCSRRSTPGCP